MFLRSPKKEQLISNRILILAGVCVLFSSLTLNNKTTLAETTDNNPPVVESSTHPDSNKWYSNSNPSFTWEVPVGVSGVSYLINEKATANPGPKSDGLVDRAIFNNIDDGIKYFNIKFKRGSDWGPIAHYQFNIDTVPPVEFDIQSVTVGGIQPEISFKTEDLLSGIDHYEILINGDDTVTVPANKAGEPYRLSFDRIGSQTVYVKAFDKAGNITTESIDLQISGSAVGSIFGMWVVGLFDIIVNIISTYFLSLVAIAFFAGILISIYHLLGNGIDRLWHHWDKRREIKATKNKSSTPVITKLLDDISGKIKILNVISKQRRLNTDERSLKLKLEKSFKILKGNG